MVKTSTFYYSVNNLASKTNGEFYEINSVLNYQKYFKDVYNTLDELDIDVDQSVVDRILAKASKM